MPADGCVGASSVAERVRSIECLVMRHRRRWNNHAKSIIGHARILSLFLGATVYGSSDIPRVAFWISRCRINRHPTLSVTKLTINHAPCVGATTRLPDGPTLLFGVLQSFSDVFIRMVRHFPAVPLVLRSFQLYHHDLFQRNRCKVRLYDEILGCPGFVNSGWTDHQRLATEENQRIDPPRTPLPLCDRPAKIVPQTVTTPANGGSFPAGCLPP